MTLKADEIADLMEASDDPLVITPQPDLEDLRDSGAASVDLRLGTWFVTMRKSRSGVLRVDDPQKPVPVQDVGKTHHVAFGSDFILHPQAFALAVTLEWIRLPRKAIAYVIGKSSWGRRGLIIATATGVHPGFTGCLTLELTNLGEVPIAIKPGMQMCQLFLDTSKSTASQTDDTQFLGRCRPTVGKISIDDDDVAKRLSKGYRLDS